MLTKIVKYVNWEALFFTDNVFFVLKVDHTIDIELFFLELLIKNQLV